jgi:hypothetical protein
MDQQGRLYMLEINPYCGIFYPPATPGSADCILKFDPVRLPVLNTEAQQMHIAGTGKGTVSVCAGVGLLVSVG